MFSYKDLIKQSFQNFYVQYPDGNPTIDEIYYFASGQQMEQNDMRRAA